MLRPYAAALCFLALGNLYSAEGTWVVSASQRDPGAVEEALERLSARGARVWRSRQQFFVEGPLDLLPWETGVMFEPLSGPLPAAASLAKDFAPEGSVRGEGSIVTLDHAENAAFLGTSFLLDRVEGVAWAADGAIILDSPYAGGSSARAMNFARQFGLRVTMTDRASPVFELKRPRLGIAIQDAWLTELLDRYIVPYKFAGGPVLPSQFDTVMLGQSNSGQTDKQAAWNQFVSDGGTVVLVPSRPGTGFAKILSRTNEPVAFGMEPEQWARSETFELNPGAPGSIVSRFADSGRAAVFVETRGKGRIVSFAFRPDTYAACKLLLNSVYLGSARRL